VNAYVLSGGTVDDVLDSPTICSPLHRLDCCLVTDGGGALVITSPERVADFTDEPVYVLGASEAHVARHITGLPDLVSTPGTLSGPAALTEAGVSIEDMDHFQIYDPFTIAVVMAVEDLGPCAKGEGGAFLEDGKARPGGGLALNTDGGGLSHIFVEFDDGEAGEVDLSHLAGRGVFAAWEDRTFFEKVRINPEYRAVTWENDLDLCPDSLYLRLTGKTPAAIGL
jgi:hypothetical protein